MFYNWLINNTSSGEYMETQKTKQLNSEWERMEIIDLLFNLPFNTSLSGFSMLTEAIFITMQLNAGRMNMTKEVYSKIAKSRNINENSVEKGIKGVIDSINSASVSQRDVVYPSMMIKNALIDGKPKHFIVAVSEAIKLKKLKLATLN